jgi:hypothetical protein
VIIHIIDINRMTAVEAEGDAPIPGDRYSPKISEVSLERMQPEARKVHIIWPTAAVQYRKNVAKLFNMRGGHPSCCSPIIKGFEPAMFKRSDHMLLSVSSVTCQLTRRRSRTDCLRRDVLPAAGERSAIRFWQNEPTAPK